MQDNPARPSCFLASRQSLRLFSLCLFVPLRASLCLFVAFS